MSRLQDALGEMLDSTALVVTLRDDAVIKKLISAFKGANFAKFDPDALLEELSEIANSAAFDIDGFPLDGTDGIEAAAAHRFKLQALRDRLVALHKKLREANSKISRTYRLATVHLRQHELMKGMTVKAQDDVAYACLREIADIQENMKLVFESAKDALTSIDDKTRTLDAWYSLHKQYVFMTANRGPKGDEEGYQESKRIGSARRR